MAPRFSVLLPTHYRPDVIGFAIGSVLAQTEPDFELLVVGDGAVEGTAEVVNGFGDPRIRWFDLPKGPGFGYANRNEAMQKARGELVAHMSDDDIMLPDHLELMGRVFDDRAVQWAYSRALWVSRDGIAAPDLTNLDFEDERRFFREQANTISGTVFAYRQGAFENSARPWPEDLPSAADWQMMRALLNRHGPAAMRRMAEPTLLHFTAGRKLGRDKQHPTLRAWLRMAEAAPWWPEELRARPAGGETFQAWYMRRLQAEPDFAARLRRASDAVIARAAFERLGPYGPAQAGPGETQRIRAERDAALAEVERLKTEIALRDLIIRARNP